MKIFLAPLIVFIFSLTVFTQKKTDLDVAVARAEKSTAVLKNFFALGSDTVPFEVFRKAKAVAVFNDVTQINLLLSKGTKGKGLMSVRNGDSWGIPTFVEFGSVGFDFKIAGKKKLDIVFFIMEDKLIEVLKKEGIKPDKLTDKKLALGPIVKGKGADTVLENAWLIYYTFQDGKLSGLEFQNDNFFSGVAIGHDNNLNKMIYQKKAQIIIAENINNLIVPDTINNFRQAILEVLQANR